MTDIFLSPLYKGEYCAECINDRVWVAQVDQCQECNDSLQNIRKETKLVYKDWILPSSALDPALLNQHAYLCHDIWLYSCVLV